MSRNKITIPVFPHVKKFIMKQYHNRGTVKTEEYSSLGKMVTLALRDMRQWPVYNNNKKKQLSEEITLHLTNEQAKLSPRVSKLLRINIDMDREFKDHLVSWIHAGRALGVPPFVACKRYLSFYQIDETEYSLDAAYRYWQRKGQPDEDIQ